MATCCPPKAVMRAEGERSRNWKTAVCAVVVSFANSNSKYPKSIFFMPIMCHLRCITLLMYLAWIWLHEKEKKLAQFERHKSQYCQQNGYCPKAGNDFGFVQSLFLVVMMQGRHQENAPPFAKFILGVFEITNL